MTYIVTVKNARNLPVAGQAVSLNTNLGTLSAQSSTTDANGQAQAKLYSRTDGFATVTANVVEQTLTAPVVEFTAVYNMTLAYDKQSASSDGVDAITFTLTATNGNR